MTPTDVWLCDRCRAKPARWKVLPGRNAPWLLYCGACLPSAYRRQATAYLPARDNPIIHGWNAWLRRSRSRRAA
jgi:hypothetical protein